MKLSDEFESTVISAFNKEMGRYFNAYIEDIKQNGIDPKSKLFWALIAGCGNYAFEDSDGTWVISSKKPKLVHEQPINGGKGIYRWGYAPLICRLSSIKINYTGDWKDSLHYRGDYE